MPSHATHRVTSKVRALLSWLCRGQYLVVALCVALLVVDIGFVLLHVVAAFCFPENRLLYIDVDRSYAEIFQAVKYVMAAVFLGCAAVVGRAWPLIFWIPVFLGFLVTDLLEVHERVGRYLGQALPSAMWGERSQDVWELCVYLLGAAVMAVVVGFGYRLGSSGVRWAFRVMGMLIVFFVVFGMGADFLHSLLPRTSMGADMMMLVEDGGEMLVVSGFMVFVARLVTVSPLLNGPQKELAVQSSRQ